MQSFSEKVYSLCRKIPKGKVATYRQLANALGTKAYRAVGQALHNNPYPKVPCHRVISSSGNLYGFAAGLRKKKKLLESEGVVVKNNKVDLRKCQVKHF